MERIVVVQTKSVGIAIILTIFFGPIGLFYASVSGALFLIFGVPFIIGIFLGAGIFNEDYTMVLGSIGIFIVFIVFEWLISIIWSVVAVNNYNNELTKKSENMKEINTEYSKPNQSNQTPKTQEIRENRTPNSDFMPKKNEKNNDKPTLEEWLRLPGRTENGYNLKFKAFSDRKSATQITINKKRK